MNFLEKIHREHQNAWEVEFKNPCALYGNACESVSKYFYIVGVERFRSEYSRINARLIFLVVDLVLYLVLSVWCIFELWGDMVDVIFCILFEAIAGLMASDMCFFVLIMSGVGQLDVLIIYLQKLGEITMKCDGSQKNDEQYQLLVEIVEKHVEHIAYLNKMETLKKNYFFGNFGCLIFETVTSLYVIATVDEIWYPGFIIVFGGIIQIGLPCVLGTLLSNKNDQLIREIYNTPWNMLSVSEQKLLQLLLHSAQNPVVLSDGFCPINLFNFVSIYKKIYSFLMMLLSIN
ncbi:Odorant receptor 94b [Culex quinquefasciatus]|uniref:Odorant receptor 94b n=1 Tax=Culex quinquefasciatus TaxID=7176 RepID=B0X043_CULQU|nr:Odorant receptor 94b [Culex quinquefasciatus]|eukprot:XP_001863015.1 Odorant receptor 94b [Culex quinquefasciatus]